MPHSGEFISGGSKVVPAFDRIKQNADVGYTKGAADEKTETTLRFCPPRRCLVRSQRHPHSAPSTVVNNFVMPSRKFAGYTSSDRIINTARRTIAGFEAMLWLGKGFGFSGGWPVNDHDDLLAHLFGLQKVNKA